MNVLKKAVSVRREVLAYETLWGIQGQTEAKLNRLFRDLGNPLPSTALAAARPQALFPVHDELMEAVRVHVDKIECPYSVSLIGTFQYPDRIMDANHPARLFYYRGDIGLLERRSVSIVGARDAGVEGLKRAAKLARMLVRQGYAVVSGLARGVDTSAMTAAIEEGGLVIGVIGTPICETYPKENADLQERIASEHLLISHVPFYRYATESFRTHRRYFPERNTLMAALSGATIIVEASDKSGTLTQARAALQQGRKLMVLNSCFENPAISWPSTYERRGAIRIRDIEDVMSNLEAAPRTDA